MGPATPRSDRRMAENDISWHKNDDKTKVSDQFQFLTFANPQKQSAFNRIPDLLDLSLTPLDASPSPMKRFSFVTFCNPSERERIFANDVSSMLWHGEAPIVRTPYCESGPTALAFCFNSKGFHWRRFKGGEDLQLVCTYFQLDVLKFFHSFCGVHHSSQVKLPPSP